MLEYAESLCSAYSTILFKLNEVLRKNLELREQLLRSMSAAEDRFYQVTAEGLRERQNIEQQNKATLEENSALKIEICNLKVDLEAIKDLYDCQLTLLQAENVE